MPLISRDVTLGICLLSSVWKVSLCCDAHSEVLPPRSPIGLSSNWVVLIFFLGTSNCEEVLDVPSVSRVILKSAFFTGVVAPFSEAEGPTVLGSPAVEVTSDAGPNGSNQGQEVWVGSSLEFPKGA